MINFKIFILIIFITGKVFGQDSIIPLPENMVAEGIPSLHVSIAYEVIDYTESRSTPFVAWYPHKKEMLITSRYGNT